MKLPGLGSWTLVCASSIFNQIVCQNCKVQPSSRLGSDQIPGSVPGCPCPCTLNRSLNGELDLENGVQISIGFGLGLGRGPGPFPKSACRTCDRSNTKNGLKKTTVFRSQNEAPKYEGRLLTFIFWGPILCPPDGRIFGAASCCLAPLRGHHTEPSSKVPVQGL